MMTHYQVLGVDSKSETAAIRAAYLKLIKQHHPDRRGRRKVAGDDVYRINFAYSVLRDHAKRDEYDAELMRERLRISYIALPAGRVPVTVRPRYGRSWSQVAAILILVSCLVGSIPGDTPAVAESGPAGIALAGAERAALLSYPNPAIAAALRGQPELDPGIQDVVEIASFATLDQAGAASRRCFAEIRFDSIAAGADRCIAFDMAFSYWNDGEFSGRPAEEYFLPSSLQRRHHRALQLVSIDDTGSRLAAIRGKTFSTLVDILAARRKGAELRQGAR